MPPAPGLYIRFSATDNGDRPLPSAAQWWLSPALEILGSGLGTGTVVAGVNQQVRVYVGNGDTNARTDVMVRVYAADWGVSNPWLQSLGGGAGRAGGPFTVVGSAQVQTMSEGVIDIGWNPSTVELQGDTHRHVCLFANVFRSGGADGAPLPDPPTFDIPGNAHHAQRNITLSAASLAKPMHFKLHIGNLGDEEDEFLVEVVQPRGRRLMAVDRRQLAGAAWVRQARAKLGRALGALPASEKVELAVRGGPTGPRVPIGIGPGEQVPVTLRALAGAEPGVHRFDIVQRSRRRRRIVGGARLLAVVAPDELFPKLLLDEQARFAG